MKIELLYFDGCPHWLEALEEVNAILKEHQLSTEVELIKVTSQEEAEHTSFLGSPTVRIDGFDVELDIPDSGYGMECRIYWVEDRPQGRPPQEWIAAAIEAALE